MGENSKENKKVVDCPLSPLKAIRQKCLDCCCWSSREVSLCTTTKCPLYEYRFGKQPESMRHKMSDEQRKVLAEKMREINKKRENKNEQSSVE